MIAQGDSTDPEFVSRVTKDISIRSVVCDPPYGVAYVENKDWVGLRGPSMADAVKGRKKIAGDQLQTEKEYAEFTRKWIEAIKPNLAQKNSFYIFNSDWMICALREGMKAAGLYYSQLIIWVKNSMVLGRYPAVVRHGAIVIAG